MSTTPWLKKDAVVWVENGSRRHRHRAKVFKVGKGDDIEIVWSSTGAKTTVSKKTVHQFCVDGGRDARSRHPPLRLCVGDDQSAAGEGNEVKKRARPATTKPSTRAESKRAANSVGGKKRCGKEARFAVERILGSKMIRGREFFFVRWKGYGEDEDTWEPAGNIAMTGHIDRYKRECKSKDLGAKVGTKWVVIVEYIDGSMQDTVDLEEEKFRRLHQHDVERERNTEDEEGDTDDFSLVKENQWIELFWPYAKRYYPCKIISCRTDV
jgi:hypothetical protein